MDKALYIQYKEFKYKIASKTGKHSMKLKSGLKKIDANI